MQSKAAKGDIVQSTAAKLSAYMYRQEDCATAKCTSLLARHV